MRRKTRVPSFAGLKAASLASSRAKRANRAVNTKAEVLLRSTLHRMGLRFRKNGKNLPGSPDIVFVAARTAVFCDGDFWHGRNWRRLKSKLMKGTNAQYWSEKIRTNIKRDRRADKHLTKLGWKVVRVWETDILSSPQRVAEAIAKTITARANALRQGSNGWKKA